MMALYSVYVTKLPLSITKRQLITLFSPTATVVDAYVCVNTSHTEYTYGFVRYLKLEDAKKAISEWDGVMYKDQRLMVEMSRHDSHTVPNSQDAGGARALGGRRLSGSGRVEDEGNWQELRRTWAMMKAGDETSVQWNTLVKELKQISFSLVPAFFVDDTKGSWSYSGDDPFQEEDSVTRMSPPLCRGSSQDSPQRSSERLPEAKGGDADNQNSNVKELSRSCSADTLSSAGQSDKQNTTEFDKKDTETELANGGRMTERRNSCSKRDSDVCEQDHRGFNSVSTGLQGHQRSEPNEPHVEPTENRPPVKLVSIGRGKMLSLQLG